MVGVGHPSRNPAAAVASLPIGAATFIGPASLAQPVGELGELMRAAEERLELEETARLRDRIRDLRAERIPNTSAEEGKRGTGDWIRLFVGGAQRD